jgi:L-alanine-DL-glutamate epimerase-like enolase superfamily enzyme
MLEQIEQARTQIERGIDHQDLLGLLPAGGARNAVDCALWELFASGRRKPVWALSGLSAPCPLVTTYTIGADVPASMAADALAFRDAKALKLKLTGSPLDAERVTAVRTARPDVWLGVDANQGFTPDLLRELMPVLVQAGVELIEQPFPVGREADLAGCGGSIAFAADESAQTAADLASLAGRFQVVNIKLDKCGGLTEALHMARAADALGLEVMVGNMIGTSLAMAPAFLVGQLCKVVDLDGPLLLAHDRRASASYREGRIWCGEDVWGGSS